MIQNKPEKGENLSFLIMGLKDIKEIFKQDLYEINFSVINYLYP